MPRLDLQLQRALRVGQPVFGDLAEGFDDVGDFRVLVVDAAFLARLHIGGERLAAFLDHPGDVAGERLDIDGAARNRFRRGLHVLASV